MSLYAFLYAHEYSLFGLITKQLLACYISAILVTKANIHISGNGTIFGVKNTHRSHSQEFRRGRGIPPNEKP